MERQRLLQFVTHDAFVFEELERRLHRSSLDASSVGWTRRLAPASVGPVVTQGAVALSGISPSSGGGVGDPVTVARIRATGERLWHRPERFGALGVAGDTLLAATDARVRALDPLSGRERWTT
jgi:outer membrane protein assembly factor BamB